MADTDLVVTARPVVMGRIARIISVVIVVVFVVIAITLRQVNKGLHFGVKDQVAVGILGVLAAAGIWLLSRPRLRADVHGVYERTFVGSGKTIPWDLVLRVEFPDSARFARLVLPAEEIQTLWAVHRLDGERAVEVMRGLRTLYGVTHPVT